MKHGAVDALETQRWECSGLPEDDSRKRWQSGEVTLGQSPERMVGVARQARRGRKSQVT